MARLYHRDQPGAPALSYASGQGTGHFEAFKTILKACLVSGYGAVPAAGWELISESANHLILRPGTKSGYVCFTRESTNVALTVWLAATYTGVTSGGKILGSGVRSGTDANSGLPQRITVRDLVATEASTSWGLVADAGTFVLNLSGATSSTPLDLSANASSQFMANFVLYCGDDSAGDLICMGGTNTTATAVSGNYANFKSWGFTALKHPHTGLLTDTGAITLTVPGTASASSAADYAEFPKGVVLPEAVFSEILWQSSGVVRKLRGVVVEPRLISAYSPAASIALGGPEVTSRTICVPIQLDGHRYMVGRTHGTGNPQVFLTDNPEFW
ncbi:hypothetical protein HP436_08745 [Pseudomonas sp. CrR14]|nr:hypothetical protein [Pseudomonas sp. CrR14]